MANEVLDDNPAIESNEISKDGILDILNSDEGDDVLADNDDETPAKTKSSADKNEQEKDEEDNKDNEEKDEKEEKLELTDEDELKFQDIPKRQAILKAFPDIFKKFPGIESAIYREQQYSEVFPTLADAKQANENSEQFAKFEEGILSGSLDDVLKAAKQADEGAFNKIAENLLGTLERVDGNAYALVLTQVGKGYAATLWNAGLAKGKDSEEGQRLMAAAQILHEFAFGNKQITPYQKINKTNEENPEKKELIEQKQQFYRQQLDVAVDDVIVRVKNVTKATVDRHLDPKNLMSPYIKSKAMEDILSEVDKEVLEDSRFKSILDRHWQNASDNNFNDASKQKIRNALLAKIKTVLPGVIKRVKAEALKGHSSSGRPSLQDDSDDVDDVKEERTTRKSQDRGNERTVNRSSGSGKSRDGKGMSTYDFFKQD